MASNPTLAENVRTWALDLVLAFVAVGFSGGVVLSAQERFKAVAEPWSEILAVYMFVATTLVLAGGVGVVLRRRRIETITWGLGAAQLAFPIAPIMGFVLPTFLRRASFRNALAASALYLAGLATWLTLDAQGTTRETSALRRLILSQGPPDEVVDLPVLAAVLLVLVVAAAPIAIGFVLRSRHALEGDREVLRSELDGSREELAEQQRATGELTEQLSRKEERELIAREIHDSVGSKLAIINMYASGLEAAASDPKLHEGAKFVRQSVQEASDDLRSLVNLMRNPEGLAGGALHSRANSLSELASVIDEAIGTNQSISAIVALDDATAAPRPLAHAAHRIVQELITNLLKHGDGAPCRLRVTGSPDAGLTIEASNPVANHVPPPSGPGSGSGLRGIKERAEALGGSLIVDGGPPVFAVTVTLPWTKTGHEDAPAEPSAPETEGNNQRWAPPSGEAN